MKVKRTLLEQQTVLLFNSSFFVSLGKHSPFNPLQLIVIHIVFLRKKTVLMRNEAQN